MDLFRSIEHANLSKQGHLGVTEKPENVASGDTTEAMLTIRRAVVNNVVIYRGPIVVTLPETNIFAIENTLQGTNISPQNGILKMIFLFPRWDMLIPWSGVHSKQESSTSNFQPSIFRCQLLVSGSRVPFKHRERKNNSLSTVLLVSTYPRSTQCMVYFTYIHEWLIFNILLW